MSPAPRISAERPASRVKIRAATATAAEGADAAPVAIAVSLRTRAPTSKADWNSRCKTGPAWAFEVSHASRTCPWICDSPSIMASSPAEKPLGSRRRELERNVHEQHRREARDTGERGTAPGPVPHHTHAHGPPQDHPGEHTPHDLRGIDRGAPGVSHAEPEQHTQRH